MEENRATLEKVTWKTIRKAALQVNPPFAKLIDAVDPKGELMLYKAIYPFGSVIIDGNQFYLPHTDGSLISMEDPRMEPELKEQLGYNSYLSGSTPLSLILNHSAELFMQYEDRVIPFSFMKTGKIFGLWGSMNQNIAYVAPRVWHMTAGAHALFVLPKITDVASYKKLGKIRRLKQPLPRNLLSQGKMLTQMAEHSDAGAAWKTELLFFPKAWLEKKAGVWADFHLYLHELAWEGAEYWRNKVVYDYIWDSFVQELVRNDMRVTPQVVDIVEHLIRIGLGVLPGFCPALGDEAAPISAFQEDLVKVYGLKRFAPTIMVPSHLRENDNRYIYWSLQFPTHFESTPKIKAPRSTVATLREVKQLLELFCKAVLSGKIPAVIDTPFHDFIKRVRFDFFHSESDLYEGIRPSSVMPKEDKALITCAKKFGTRHFSDVSPFVRGCVRIYLTE